MEELCRWIVAFPVATRNFLRGKPNELEELEGTTWCRVLRWIWGVEGIVSKSPCGSRKFVKRQKKRFPAAPICYMRCFVEPLEPPLARGILKDKEIERLKRSAVQTLFCCDRMREAALRATRRWVSQVFFPKESHLGSSRPSST